MRILVAIKRVIDYNARVRVNPDKVRSGGSADRDAVPSHQSALPRCRPAWTSAA
jgi:hypothetical protein